MVRTPGFHPGNGGSIPFSATKYGAVTQSGRVLPLHGRSRRFESCQLHYTRDVVQPGRTIRDWPM